MILGIPTLKVSVRHKFISLILCKKSSICYVCQQNYRCKYPYLFVI